MFARQSIVGELEEPVGVGKIIYSEVLTLYSLRRGICCLSLFSFFSRMSGVRRGTGELGTFKRIISCLAALLRYSYYPLLRL